MDGQTYEVDLRDEHAADLRATFQRYIDAGRPIGRTVMSRRSSGRVTRPRRDTTTGHARNTASIREWARAHGHEISDRGRIPAKVLQAYEKS